MREKIMDTQTISSAASSSKQKFMKGMRDLRRVSDNDFAAPQSSRHCH